jgi:glycine cleavage system protein P-like pyridoxal-binding family
MFVVVASWYELGMQQGIKDITSYIHKSGGLVYMDGANMNAQVQYTAHCYIILSHLQYCTQYHVMFTIQ